MEWLGITVVVFSFGGLVLAISYAISVHNAVVKAASDCDEAWYGIDGLLQQRHDALTTLVDACPDHIEHERDLLTRVVELQARYDRATTADDKVRTENELNRLVSRIGLSGESDPDRKASPRFTHLQSRLSAVESVIADRREFFNDGVDIHNLRIASFPDLLVARPLGYRERAFLEVPEDARRAVMREPGELAAPREEGSPPPSGRQPRRSGTAAFGTPGLSS